MGTFITIEIDKDKCFGIDECGQCLKICPLKIFEGVSDQLCVKREEEDECILCELCLSKCKSGALNLRKMYEGS